MVKKAYARMSLLQKLFTFKVSTDDLVNIYILYIRSLVEQNDAVWSSTITQEEIEDIECVQRCHIKFTFITLTMKKIFHCKDAVIFNNNDLILY
jgi:hypothetical protein